MSIAATGHTPKEVKIPSDAKTEEKPVDDVDVKDKKTLTLKEEKEQEKEKDKLVNGVANKFHIPKAEQPQQEQSTTEVGTVKLSALTPEQRRFA